MSELTPLTGEALNTLRGDFAQSGTDRLAVSSGVDNRQGSINSPTVFNASLHFAQFWDGRADTLEAQAVGPIHNPVEMASGWPEIIDRLQIVSARFADIARRFADTAGEANR